MIRSQDWLMAALEGVSGMDWPDAWIVAGAIYNMAWNCLTGRPGASAVKDIDIFYFDAADLSYEAEDRMIRRAAERFGHLPVPVELRNQARVHLWFARHFGFKIEPIRDSRDAISRFSSVAYAIGVRLNDEGELEIFAPFGLEDLFAFRIRPNRYYDNRDTHAAKAARAKAVWPELTVDPW